MGSTVVIHALKFEIMCINYNTTRSKTCTNNVIVIIVDSSNSGVMSTVVCGIITKSSFSLQGLRTMEVQVNGALEVIKIPSCYRPDIETVQVKVKIAGL